MRGTLSISLDKGVGMEIKVDELLPLCEKCEGTGRIDHYASPKNQGGFGQRVVGSLFGPCDACEGHGAIPTAEGKALIEFIQRAKDKKLIR
jgi:hypothetical protein